MFVQHEDADELTVPHQGDLRDKDGLGCAGGDEGADKEAGAQARGIRQLDLDNEGAGLRINVRLHRQHCGCQRLRRGIRHSHAQRVARLDLVCQAVRHAHVSAEGLRLLYGQQRRARTGQRAGLNQPGRDHAVIRGQHAAVGLDNAGRSLSLSQPG